jgi:hypothetical protein
MMLLGLKHGNTSEPLGYLSGVSYLTAATMGLVTTLKAEDNRGR